MRARRRAWNAGGAEIARRDDLGSELAEHVELLGVRSAGRVSCRQTSSTTSMRRHVLPGRHADAGWCRRASAVHAASVVSIRYRRGVGMTLRTSDQQTEALRRQAALEGRSMQAVALSAIDEYIARRTHKAKVATALNRVVREEASVLERLKDA